MAGTRDVVVAPRRSPTSSHAAHLDFTAIAFGAPRARDGSEYARTIIPRLKVEYQPTRSLFVRVVSDGYIGAMGSRRTNEGRVLRLRDAGLADDAIARVMSPIGLDIGARTPEETAISMCAEVIAARTGRHAGSLRDSDGPIH